MCYKQEAPSEPTPKVISDLKLDLGSISIKEQATLTKRLPVFVYANTYK